MRRHTSILAIFFVLTACASSQPQAANLSPEAQVIAASLQRYLSELTLERAHPLLLLDHTDPWLPSPPKFDAQFPESLIPGVPFDLVPSLRAANAAPAPLPTGIRHARFKLFSSASFGQAYGAEADLRALAKELGGLPLVVSFGYPYVDSENGTALVAIHSLSSWTGCGSVSLYGLQLRAGEWVITGTYLSALW